QQALAQPIKVTFGQQTWTLDPTDLGNFVVQQVDEAKSGAAAVTLSLDRSSLSQWLAYLVGDQVNREPVDAVVGWNGEPGVSIKPSVDGAKLKPATFAEAV